MSYSPTFDFLEILPIFFLLTAIVVVLFQKVKLSLGLFFLAVACGLLTGAIGYLGILLICMTGLSCLISQGTEPHLPKWLCENQWVRILSGVLFFLLSLGLMNHALPGFRNLLIFKGIQFSSDSIPFTMYLNFDKTLIGYLGILIWRWSQPPDKLHINDMKTVFATLSLLVALVIPFALWVGYVRFDPKIPHLYWIWILNNFFFVCLAEEYFFRGFIQKYISKISSASQAKAWLPILGSSILFGIAHFKGGIQYIALATCCGLFYGYAFQKTKKIEVSMCVHFGLNLLHFFFFSYPALTQI